MWTSSYEVKLAKKQEVKVKGVKTTQNWWNLNVIFRIDLLKVDLRSSFYFETALSGINFLASCEFEIKRVQCALKEETFTKQSFISQKIHKILNRNFREFSDLAISGFFSRINFRKFLSKIIFFCRVFLLLREKVKLLSY